MSINRNQGNAETKVAGRSLREGVLAEGGMAVLRGATKATTPGTCPRQAQVETKASERASEIVASLGVAPIGSKPGSGKPEAKGIQRAINALKAKHQNFPGHPGVS